MSLATEVTIEAIVTIPAGQKCFYPRTLITGADSGTETIAAPGAPTHRIAGQFAGIDYTLVSLRPFVLHSTKSSSYVLYQLSQLAAE